MKSMPIPAPQLGFCLPFLPISLRHSLRWLILAISLFAFTLIYANNITFNFSVICIIRPPNGAQNGQLANKTMQNGQIQEDPKEYFYYDYTVQQRNLLFSAAALGAICCSLGITELIGRLGSRMVFTLFGLLSAIACFLMPFAVKFGFIPMFLLRMVHGSVHPLQYIMISQLTREWSPLRTSGTYLLILSAQFQLGPVFTMPISGLLCESPFGWPAIYYLQGLLSVFAFLFFFLIYRDSPTQHPCISDKEMRSILRDKGIIQAREQKKAKKRELAKVPYKAILTDPIMWIVLFTFWSDELGFLIFSQYGPIYLNRVLGLDVKKTGLLAGLPYLLSMGAKFVSGPINDRLPWKSERIRINIFSAISQIGMIVAFVALTFLPMVHGIPEWVVQVAYTSVNIFCGLDFLGVIKCSQRISQHFASTIMAWESIISSVTVLLLPLVVGLVAPNNTVEEWARILIGIALFELVTIVLFFAFCDSKPRPWAILPKLEGQETDSSSNGIGGEGETKKEEKF